MLVEGILSAVVVAAISAAVGRSASNAVNSRPSDPFERQMRRQEEARVFEEYRRISGR